MIINTVLAITIVALLSAAVRPCYSYENHRPYLIGGNDAPLNVQFVALLNITYNKNLKDFCSATVITNNFALASAECFDGGYESFDLYTGYGQLDDESIQMRTLNSANVSYSPDKTLALLYINDTLDVRTLRMPVLCNPFEDYNTARVATYSFGRTSGVLNSKPSNRLQSLFARVSRKCSRPLNKELCAYTDAEHSGLCYGDEGSPVIVANNEHLDLLGLVYNVESSCTSRYIHMIDLRQHFFWIDSEIYRLSGKHYYHSDN